MSGKEVVRWSLFIIVWLMGFGVWAGMTPPADAADPHGVEAASYALVAALALFVLVAEETGSQGYLAKTRRTATQVVGTLAMYQGSWEWLLGSMGQPVPLNYALLWGLGGIVALVCIVAAYITRH